MALYEQRVLKLQCLHDSAFLFSDCAVWEDASSHTGQGSPFVLISGLFVLGTVRGHKLVDNHILVVSG